MSETPTPEQMQEIGAALEAGRKIEAIKLYREATGKDLRSAKEFIDTLCARLQEQDPEKYAMLSAKGAGCASVILFCSGLATAGLTWILNGPA